MIKIHFQTRKLFNSREFGVLVALVILFAVLSILSPHFLQGRNLLNVGRQIAFTGIIAVGMTLVIICREIDLSIGSIFALGGIVTGKLLVIGVALPLALLSGLLVGAIIGAINGILSTYGRMPSFIVTLGMLSVTRGTALLVSNGYPVTLNSSTVDESTLRLFSVPGQGRLFDAVPMQLVLFILVAMLGGIILKYTVFGFHVYATGGNRKAAVASGVRIKRVALASFIIVGVLSAFAGILNLSFLQNIQANAGVGMELDVIAAVIIGGTSLFGGLGSVIGTVIGVLLIGLLRNGLVLLGISPFVQEVVIGLVIIFAVGINQWIQKSRTG